MLLIVTTYPCFVAHIQSAPFKRCSIAALHTARRRLCCALFHQWITRSVFTSFLSWFDFFFLLLPVQHGRLRFTVIRCGTVLLMAGLRVLACELLNSGATSLWLSASSHLNVECHSISVTSNLTVSPLSPPPPLPPSILWCTLITHCMSTLQVCCHILSFVSSSIFSLSHVQTQKQINAFDHRH